MKRLSKKIILVGKAGSGKDYFKNFLIEKGFIPSVSYTTRERRTEPIEEVDGETYHFISDEDFMFMVSNDQFFEFKHFNSCSYGTSTYDWDTAEVFIYTPSGIKDINRKNLNECIVIYFDIPVDVRINRMEERNNPDEIQRRLDADNADFRNFTEFDIRVKNPNFDANELLKLILRGIEVC